MKQKELNYFKDLLSERLHNLIHEAGRTVNGMSKEKTSSFPDPTDRATLESDRNFDLRIRDRERKLINKISDALDRIEEGTFGICDVCGDEISVKRLKVRPVTTLCIKCKEEQEVQEKKLGI